MQLVAITRRLIPLHQSLLELLLQQVDLRLEAIEARTHRWRDDLLGRRCCECLLERRLEPVDLGLQLRRARLGRRRRLAARIRSGRETLLGGAQFLLEAVDLELAVLRLAADSRERALRFGQLLVGLKLLLDGSLELPSFLLKQLAHLLDLLLGTGRRGLDLVHLNRNLGKPAP